MTADDLLTVPQLAAAGNVTARQIRYWTRWGVIEAARDTTGAGHPALYHPNLIPVVATLGRITDALEHRVGLSVLARIADRHADGVLEIAPNIVLIWEPPSPLDELLTDEQADRLLALLRGDNPPHQVTGGFRP